MLRANGFSLLELLCVLAVVAVLYLVAWPSYEQQLLSAERRATTALLARLQQQQEHFRFQRGRYALQLVELGWAEPLTVRRGEPVAAASSPSYAVTLVGDAQRYRLIAQPLNAQLQDRRCGVLEVDQHSQRRSNTGTTPQCWY